MFLTRFEFFTSPFSSRRAFCSVAKGARLVATFGSPKREPADWMVPAEKFVEKWRTLFYPRISCGARSYAFMGSLADVENALLDYTLEYLQDIFRESGDNFEFVEVADIVPINTTQACGVLQKLGAHPIQYHVLAENPETGVQTSSGLCLSGTAEMGIADQLKGRTFAAHKLPAYFISQSRCFRPEISTVAIEGGIYRVHEFTKVEIFAVCTESQSDGVLGKLVGIQRGLLEPLGLHCRVLDMPADELGPSASQKFDIEAWMPGRRIWGELTSASNCTDYQSQRLGIRYSATSDAEEETRFAHTCNGTALAAPRTIIALIETFQAKKGRLELPDQIKQRLPETRSKTIRMKQAPAFSYKF